MKNVYRFIALSIFALFATHSFAQEISFVGADLDKVNSQIIITYNLLASGKSYHKFVVDIYYSTDKGKTFSSEPLKYVTGDVGNSLEPGFKKKVLWNYFMENADFDGKNLVFKLSSKVDMQAEENRIMNMGGPEKALYSIIPGMGDYEVRSGKRYWIITAATLSTFGAGLYLGSKSQSNYNKYLSASTGADASSLYSKYNNNRQLATILITTAATAWVADIVLCAIRGNKNKQLQRTILKKREEESKAK